MAYCVYGDISLDTNISTSDVSNADITSLILKATKILNSKINVEVNREEITYIDDTRENKIDGSNTTYYIRNWKDKYFGDSNNDGSITTADITVYAIASDGTETTVTVNSIDATNKSFTLSTAYSSSYRLQVTYKYCFVNPSTPDPLIVLACEYLTASLAYAKINIGRSPEIVFGSKRIMRHMGASKEWLDKANEIIEEINYKGANLKEVNNSNGSI